MTENEQVEDVVTESEGDEKVDTQQPQKGKVFTQEEVNKIVAKEKASWKKVSDRERSTLDAAEAALRGDVEFYETQFKAIVAKQVADFDPITLELFNSLPVREQMEKLANADFMAKVQKKAKIPETPKESSNSNNEGGFFKRKSSL